MSRPRSRRLTVLATVSACLASAAVPALAGHDPNHREVTVAAVAGEGVRQFFVYEQAADTDLSRLSFDGNSEQPFRVVVRDTDRSLSGGFEVSASLTNLYFKNTDGTYDLGSVIPSRNLSLAFSPTNPLEATGVELPLVPQVAVTGQLLDCTDPGVQDLLGIEVPLLGGVLGTLTDYLNSLTGAQGLLCDALSGGLAIDTVISDTGSLPLPVDVDGLTDLAGLAGLADLPVGLLGGQDSGAFLNPAFVGPIAPDAPVGAAAATSKRVMSGTPNITDTLLSSVTSTLESTVGADLLGATGLISIDELLAGLADQNLDLVTGLTSLGGDTAGVTSLLSGLTAAPGLGLVAELVQIDSLSLSTVSGDYVARPVLTANTVAARPGTYEGTMTIDFFDGVE